GIRAFHVTGVQTCALPISPDFAVPDQAARLGDTRAPLAVRMRPASLDEVVGQQHLLGPGSPLRRLVEGSGAASVLLYGPPGTGKIGRASCRGRGWGALRAA